MARRGVQYLGVRAAILVVPCVEVLDAEDRPERRGGQARVLQVVNPGVSPTTPAPWRR